VKEQKDISRMLAQQCFFRNIAKALRRDVSTKGLSFGYDHANIIRNRS